MVKIPYVDVNERYHPIMDGFAHAQVGTGIRFTLIMRIRYTQRPSHSLQYVQRRGKGTVYQALLIRRGEY